MNVNELMRNENLDAARARSVVVRETVARLKSLNDFVTESIVSRTADRETLQKEAMAKKEAKIRAKLDMGIPLTGKEMDFLRRYCPQLYVIAVRVELKRKMLEEKLSHARSKEEVWDIQLEAIATIRKDDPAKKYMVATVNKTMDKFKKTQFYKRLPESKEEAKAQNKKDDNFAIKLEDDEVNGKFQVVYEWGTGVGVGAYQIAYMSKNIMWNKLDK